MLGTPQIVKVVNAARDMNLKKAALEKHIKTLKNTIHVYMGDNETLERADGATVYTYTWEQYTLLDTERLQEEDPKLWEAMQRYIVQKDKRVGRFK